MDLTFLQEYCTPVIVGICLCAGFIIKKWVKDVDNKLIPTLCGILGLVLSLAVNWGRIDLTVILSGLMSGLAATGLHQAFTQLIGGKEHGSD